jgi:hypothetical protein
MPPPYPYKRKNINCFPHSKDSYFLSFNQDSVSVGLHSSRSSLPTLGRECPESTDFDTYTSDFDTQGIYSLSEISKRDNAGVGELPEMGITGVSELPKRLNDQKIWKRLHDVLADESAGLTPTECQRRKIHVSMRFIHDLWI